MTQYITEIQRQLVEVYGFPKGANGCPQNVPDGAYPMLIEKKLDLVVIVNGTIWCCNFITEKDGLRKFQAEARAKAKDEQREAGNGGVMKEKVLEDENEKLKDEVRDLKERLEEIHSWAVCGAITTAEDMMQNLPRIVEISGPEKT
jgi:hypothetical protein